MPCKEVVWFGGEPWPGWRGHSSDLKAIEGTYMVARLLNGYLDNSIVSHNKLQEAETLQKFDSFVLQRRIKDRFGEINISVRV